MCQFGAILHFKTENQMEIMPHMTTEPPLKYSRALNAVM
jgi:hypothetical protein